MMEGNVSGKALATGPRAWSQALDRGWLIVAAELLIVCTAAALFWPTTLSLLVRWEPSSSTTYGHGYLIVVISLWLLVRNRDRLRALEPRPNLWAAALLVPLGFVWLVVLRAGVESAHQVLLPVFLWLAVCAALGPAIAWRSTFPIAYLFFGLPVWDLINGALQTGTVVAADFLLRLSHVNAYVEGNVVHLAAGVFEIAGGCSGLHFFIVAMALATLSGEINNDTRKVRVQLLALAAALALLTNWVRVYTIIMAGYLTDMQHYLVRVEHYKFGWVVFAVMMALYFLIARRFPVSDGAVPAQQKQYTAESPRGVATGIAIALIAQMPASAWNMLVPLANAAAPRHGALLPRDPGRWQGPTPATGKAWQPVFVGADLTDFGEYTAAGRRVSMYTAIYLSQVQGRELTGYSNSIAGKGAAVVADGRRAGKVPMREMVMENHAGTSVVRYFYRVDATTHDHDTLAAVSYGLQSLTHAPLSRVVAVRAACASDCNAARAALDDFMSAVAALPATTPSTDPPG